MALMTAREFNQDVSAAKRSAGVEPVVITDRGEPAFVLLTYAEFERLAGRLRSVVDVLRQDDPESDFAIEFPRASVGALGEVDL